jgi:hypothetical protein
MKMDVENQLEKERQEHEKIVTTLEDQCEKREQKYSVRTLKKDFIIVDK